MPQPAFKPFTADEYFELPENGKHYQLIAGDLFMSPSPNTRHQRLVRALVVPLSRHADERRLGEVFVAPFDVQLTDVDVYQPDICFYSNERAGRITEQGARGAPDLVVEILSPSTAKNDRGPKLRQYGQSGVVELWMIDPDANTVAVYHFDKSAEPVQMLDATGVIESITMPGLRLELGPILA